MSGQPAEVSADTSEVNIPSFISIGEEKFLTEGYQQVIHFGGGDEAQDPAQIVLRSDFVFTDWSRECEYDLRGQGGIVCPRGNYSATVDVEFVTGDIFTGFSLYEGDHHLFTRIFPLVKGDGVTPYLISEIDRTNEAAYIEVHLVNMGPSDFLDDVVVTVDPPGIDNDQVFDLENVSIKVGERVVSDPILITFGENGYHFVSVQVDGENFDPLGFDIFHEIEKVFMPSVIAP